MSRSTDGGPGPRASNQATQTSDAEPLNPSLDFLGKYQRLVAKAQSLDERLRAFQQHSPAARDITTLPSDLEVDATAKVTPHKRRQLMLKRWSKATARHDIAALRQRAEWDDWSLEEVVEALAADGTNPTLAGSGSEPDTHDSWSEWLARIEEQFRTVRREVLWRGTVTEADLFDDGRALPFLEVLAPYLRVARASLNRRRTHQGAAVSRAAYADLTRRLLHDLTHHAVDALFGRFNLLRGLDDLLPDGPQATHQAAEGREIYLDFVRSMLDDGWRLTWNEYPGLARQLVRLCTTWVNTTAEFLDRWTEDQEAIRTRILKLDSQPGTEPLTSHPPLRIERVHSGLSDRHSGGRQVAVLELSTSDGSTHKVVYKPRDLALEDSVHAFLQWLATKPETSAWAPPSLTTLPRQGYGWVQFAEGGWQHTSDRPTGDRQTIGSVPEKAPGDDEISATDYYQRAGGLVAIAWLLRADDLHADNIISTNRGPVVVDAETFFQPSLEPNATDAYASSCLRSQLLSAPQSDQAGSSYDFSGLAGTGGYVAELKRRFWKNTNTDVMSFEERTVGGPQPPNRPQFSQQNGRFVEAFSLSESAALNASEAKALISGFEQACLFFANFEGDLLSDATPLGACASAHCRVLLRPSQVYGKLLTCLVQSRYQASGVQGFFLNESLHRAFSHSAERPVLWDLATAERQQIFGRDVPHFTLDISRRSFEGAQQPSTPRAVEAAADHFAVSGWDSVRLGLKRLARDPQSLIDRQCELLRRALQPAEQPLSATTSDTRSAFTPTSGATRLMVTGPIDQRILSMVRTLADSLQDDVASDQAAAERLDLYGGAAGRVLLSAALAHATCMPSYTKRSFVELEALCTASTEGLGPMGACTGLPSLLYASVLAHRLLTKGRVPLLEHQCEAAANIELQIHRWATEINVAVTDDETMHTSKLWDLADGIAGSIVALLAYHQAFASSQALESARRCGHALLQAAESPTRGPRRFEHSRDTCAWPDREGRYLEGMAHGASGIGTALARLAAALRMNASTSGAPMSVDTDIERFSAAALAGFRYERSIYDEDAGNWPVVGILGHDRKPTFMMGWCHGAPGVGLSRASALVSLGQEPELKTDLLAALETCTQAPLSDWDFVCCGNLARLDLLIEVGTKWRKQQLLSLSQQLAGQGIDRIVREGDVRLDRPGATGFFRGKSGIAYTLLRAVHPELPSVLSFNI